MCDFTGGSFSILQQGVDTIYNGKTKGNWSFFCSGTDSFNLVKFMLGVISIVFDLTFMFQHFYLYPDNDEKEKSPLLPNDKAIPLKNNSSSDA